MKKNFHLQSLLSLALAAEIIYIMIATIGDLRDQIPTFLICYGLIFVIYWIAAVVFFDFRSIGDTPQKGKARKPIQATGKISWLERFLTSQRKEEKLAPREILIIGVIFGVAFRITMFLTTPSLSDDIYRYIWDGKVANHGMNPFQYSPDAEALSALQDQEHYPRINHKEISTIYPPVNQMVFAGLYWLHPSLTTFRVAFILFDLLAAGALFLLLKHLRMNPCRVLIYFWNPLVVVEFSSSAHADIIGIFLLSLALLLLAWKRLQWSNMAVVLSFLSKFIAVLLLPILTSLKKHNRIIIVLAFVLFAAVFYLPYADAGGGLVTGLTVYASKWQFNPSIFAIILSGVKSILPESWIVNFMITPYGFAPDAETIATRGTDLALMISKGVVALIFAVISVFYLVRLRKDLAREGEIWVFKLGLILFGSFLLLNPTVQPWYLCWLLPFLVVVPNRACILLTGLVGLSYWIFVDYSKTGVWQESNWVRWVEYLPFYLVLVLDVTLSKFKARPRQV